MKQLSNHTQYQFLSNRELKSFSLIKAYNQIKKSIMKTKILTLRQLFILSFLFIGITLQAQILDLESTTEGVLIPRMTTAERTAIVAPAQALLVYDTDTGSFWFYEDAVWNKLGLLNTISDADNDTKIQVEESPDEDKIRFDLGGTEQLLLQRNDQGHLQYEPSGSSFNLLLGENAGDSLSGSQNTFIGLNAGREFDGGSSNGNILIGPHAGAFSSGNENIILGIVEDHLTMEIKMY